MCYLLQRMLDFMQDDADDVVIDTADLHKSTGLSVCIIHLHSSIGTDYSYIFFMILEYCRKVKIN